MSFDLLWSNNREWCIKYLCHRCGTVKPKVKNCIPERAYLLFCDKCCQEWKPEDNLAELWFEKQACSMEHLTYECCNGKYETCEAEYCLRNNLTCTLCDEDRLIGTLYCAMHHAQREPEKLSPAIEKLVFGALDFEFTGVDRKVYKEKFHNIVMKKILETIKIQVIHQLSAVFCNDRAHVILPEELEDESGNWKATQKFCDRFLTPYQLGDPKAPPININRVKLMDTILQILMNHTLMEMNIYAWEHYHEETEGIIGSMETTQRIMCRIIEDVVPKYICDYRRVFIPKMHCPVKYPRDNQEEMEMQDQGATFEEMPVDEDDSTFPQCSEDEDKSEESEDEEEEEENPKKKIKVE